MNLNLLCQQATEGNTESEARLFESLSVRFRLFVRRKIWDAGDAEEIVQDALMAVLKKYKEADFRTDFTAWAHRVLHNQILRYYRKKSLQHKKFETVEDCDVMPGNWHPDPVLKRNLLDCIKEIAKSNRRYARIVNLHHQGFTTQEVSEKLNLSRDHTYVVLYRARAALEQCLKRKGSQ